MSGTECAFLITGEGVVHYGVGLSSAGPLPRENEYSRESLLYSFLDVHDLLRSINYGQCIRSANQKFEK